MHLATSSLQVSSARATVDLEQHQQHTHCIVSLPQKCVYNKNQFSVCLGLVGVLHRLLHNLTIKNTSSDDQHVQINCYHNNNTSEPTAVQLCLERHHTLPLTNQVAGMAPCDSATSICRSEIICLQLKPSEPQRARSSPWLWIHYPSKISLLFTHGALFVSVTTQRRGPTYSCQTCLQFQLLVAPLSTVF